MHYTFSISKFILLWPWSLTSRSLDFFSHYEEDLTIFEWFYLHVVTVNRNCLFRNQNGRFRVITLPKRKTQETAISIFEPNYAEKNIQTLTRWKLSDSLNTLNSVRGIISQSHKMWADAAIPANNHPVLRYYYHNCFFSVRLIKKLNTSMAESLVQRRENRLIVFF